MFSMCILSCDKSQLFYFGKTAIQWYFLTMNIVIICIMVPKVF